MTLGGQLHDTIAHSRALLFVPGHRPDRFHKAAATDADTIILDLEDAVSPEAKDAARQHVADFLRERDSVVVRINAPGTPWHDDDIDMLRQHRCGIMLPKARAPGPLAEIARRAPEAPLIPLFETATGILDARATCLADNVVRPAIGTVDLALELGIDHSDHAALRHARSSLVLAASSAGVAPPLDGVTTAVHDDATLIQDAQHAAALGFTGKLCVHPGQVPNVRSAFAPSPELVHWARRVLRASDEDSVTVLDGQMIDKPVLVRAHAILRCTSPT